MILCVAEKPSVAKELAKVLDANSRNDGFFEGNGYAVTWTYGHFCTLKAPDDYDKRLRSWDLNWLPIIPNTFGIKLVENEGSLRQFKVIETLIQRADCEHIINCGDAAQEGELIQRWVYQKAGNKKPVKRLWISSLTETAIREGFANLKDAKEYDQLYYAGSARAIGDWLLGINASRLYTVKYGTGKNVLSIGRVQTPTLAMIVNRFLEIEKFNSEAFWELKTSYRDVQFNYDGGRFIEKEKSENLLAEINDKVFEIVDFSKNPGKEFAPKLFDLTSLQVDCNKKLNLSADETLKIVQTLYERKLVTYPRVDTTYLPTDMYPKIPNILNQLKSYLQIIKPISKYGLKQTKRVFDDSKITDHHAIIPTGIQSASLGGKEAAVYEAIVYRFLANFYPDCEVSNTKVKGKVNEHLFNANGREILIPGWRVLYQQSDDKDDEKENEKEQSIPGFELGESGSHQPEIIEKKTQPPKLFTEATLLRAMETAGKQVDDEELRELMKANGIGRPSTRANIIETLFKRNYITRKRKSLIPTNTGIELIATIEYELLKSPELTGQWEQKLSLIERGKYDLNLFIGEMKDMVRQLIQDVKYKAVTKNIGEVEPEKKESKKRKPRVKKEKFAEDVLVCPKCKKGKILKGKSAYGCSEWKAGCNFRIPFEELEKRFQTKKLKKENIGQWLS
ncbi:MAG: DNA topoisomerase 3 [Bacteroidales bacterium]|nr:DNA topoisomerase 3 [Bacteroidales bacterium]